LTATAPAADGGLLVIEFNYMPVMKAKGGELDALKHLHRGRVFLDDVEKPSQHQGLCPLLEIQPVLVDDPGDSNEVATIATDQSKKLLKAKGSNVEPFFFDLSPVYLQISLAYALEYLRSLMKESKSAMPVLTNALDDPLFLDEVKVQIVESNRPVAVRVNADQLNEETWEDSARDLADSVNAIEAHLVLDFATTIPNAAYVAYVIQTMKDIKRWASITVAGASFPQDMSGLVIGPNRVVRKEWALWQDLRVRQLKVRPIFGDYTVSNPILPDVDPKFMRIAAKIKYTANGDWIVFKGRDVKKHSFGQFHSLSQQLAALPEFRGAAFSWGDDSIEQCAKHTTGSGNMRTWVAIGTNHHIVTVLEQLATLPAVSAPVAPKS
jgi:Beta protein